MDGQIREYRYLPSTLVLGGVALAWAVVAGAHILKLGATWLVSDLSHVALWPLWLRYLLLAVMSGWNAAGLACIGGGVWFFAALLRVRRQRIVLDDAGVHFIAGGSRKEFPWTHVCLCSQHVFAVWIGAGRDGFWVLRVLHGFREMQNEILARVLRAQSDSGGATPAG